MSDIKDLESSLGRLLECVADGSIEAGTAAKLIIDIVMSATNGYAEFINMLVKRIVDLENFQCPIHGEVGYASVSVKLADNGLTHRAVVTGCCDVMERLAGKAIDPMFATPLKLFPVPDSLSQ